MTFFIRQLHPRYIIQHFKYDATINLPGAYSDAFIEKVSSKGMAV